MLATKQNTTEQAKQPLNTSAKAVSELRFRRLLTDFEWAKLPQTTKARFSSRLADNQSKLYAGHIVKTRLNLFGKLLGQVMRLLGAPVPLEAGNDGAPALVTVSGDNGAQTWTRQYGGKKKLPQVIRSRKQFTGPTGLEEFLGHGMGITLKLSVADNALLFTADRYFLMLFGMRCYLPNFMTPGNMVITHADLGHGDFTFSMLLTHRILGTLVNQEVFFSDQ